MQLTDQERAAVVEELAEAIYTEYAMRDADRIPFMPWDAEAGPRMNEVRQEFRRQAYACLPIIDRLLAAADAPGLDELLNSVHPESAVTAWLESRPEPESGIMAPHFMAKIETHGKNVFWGDGTTRMLAIKNAVAQATATQEGGQG